VNKHWIVYTPIFDVTIPVLDYGEGPTEPCRDVVCADAPNRRAAIVEGVRKLRQIDNGYLQRNEGYGNPFSGIKAELAEVCEHGVLMCDCNADGNNGECRECDERADFVYCDLCDYDHQRPDCRTRLRSAAVQPTRPATW
jgi:hypothetical protein